MHKTIKNLLGISVILVLITLTIGLAVTSWAISSGVNRVEEQTFTVTGEAEIQATPDVAIFTYTIIDEGSLDLKKLQKNNKEIDTAIIDYLKVNEVEAKDIKTTSYNVYPERSYTICEAGEECLPDEIVSYSVNKTVRVKVRDIDRAGEFVAMAVEKGADSVSNLNFTFDDDEELQNQAREEAIAKAREKAEGMAKSGKFKVGKLVDIYEGYKNYDYEDDYAYSMKSMAIPEAAPMEDYYEPTPIEVGESTIRSEVSLTFQMK